MTNWRRLGGSRSLFGLGVLALLLFPQKMFAAASVSVTPITWNVIGLDSNNVNSGPDRFPIAARVTNTGTVPLTNVTADFVWADAVTTYINLRPGSPSSPGFPGITFPSLAVGAFVDAYFEVQLTRDPTAYNNTRRYSINVTSTEAPAASTPTPREIFIEHLISQSRNSTSLLEIGTSVANLAPLAVGNTTSLAVGGTYVIRLTASTATAGYEQLESFVNFDTAVFRILSVSSTYSADTSPNVPTPPLVDGQPDNKLYADGCTWESDPNSPNYRSCLGTGKAGGNIVITYTVKVLSVPGTNPLTLNALVHDFSGSSYHYNANFGSSSYNIAVVDPTTLVFTKKFSPNPTNAGGVSALTFTVNNPNNFPVSGLSFDDVFPTSPGAMVVASIPGVTTNGCGAATVAAAAGANGISFSGGTVGAVSNCTVKVNVTVPTATSPGNLYVNTSQPLLVGGASSGKTASDSLTVGTAPPVTAAVCAGIPTMATWNFTTMTSPYASAAPVAPSGVAASAVAGSGISSPPLGGSGYWGSNGAIFPGATLDTTKKDYFEFAIDTTNYASVSLVLDAGFNSGNGPTGVAVYYGTTSLPAAENGTLLYSNANAIAKQNVFSTITVPTAPLITGAGLNPNGNTYFRVYSYNSKTESAGSDFYLDNVTFTGCKTPLPPRITKSFSPPVVAKDGTSTLTFTITNPNTPALAAFQLDGIAFTDVMPAGVIVSTPTSTTCGTGTVTISGGGTQLNFSGGSLAANSTGTASCTVTALTTVTTTGPHDNVSGFVTSTTTGSNNAGAAGIATASIVAIAPPAITKAFGTSTLFAGGTTTLTFSISNPNTSTPISGVGFSDTLPTAPGAMTVASTPGATTSGCGTPTLTAAANTGSISMTGGTIAANSVCVVTVNVTIPATPTTGTYTNSIFSVSHVVSGAGTVPGTTGLPASLTAKAPSPSLAFIKEVGATNAGPWVPNLAVAAGANVFYRFTVENTGDVPLNSVTINDPKFTAAQLAPCTVTLPIAVAANNNHIATCVVGPVVAAAVVTPNTATASGTPSTGGTAITSPSDTATYQPFSISMVKDAVQKYFTNAGQVVNYTYKITNLGPATLSTPPNPAPSVTDNKATVTCPAYSTATGGTVDNLFTQGESIICTASYTITAGDVTAASVTNLATATVAGAGSGQQSKNVPKANANFGHLPTSGSPAYASNLFNASGASHLTGSSFLGAVVPNELDGTNGAFTRDAVNDDGVFPTPATPWKEGDPAGANGGSLRATVVCATGTCFLGAWIDWNGDGNFTGPNEQVTLMPLSVLNGVNTFTFPIPVTTSAGTLVNGSYFMRFRLYSANPGATMSPTGQATNSSGSAATVGEVEDQFFTVTNGVVTPVTVSYFNARRQGNGTAIDWSTSTESANVGFNLYVRKAGKLVKVNEQIIPSKAIDSLERLDYSYFANTEGSEWVIEEVSVQRSVRKHGPYAAEAVIGSREVTDKIDWKAVKEQLQGSVVVHGSNAKGGPATSIGLRVRETGIYRLTYEGLKASGLDLNGVPKAQIAITNQGQPVPLYVQANGQFGPGCYIEFQGAAIDTIYTDTNYYTLEINGSRSVHMPVNNALPGMGLPTPAFYNDVTLVHRQRAYGNYAPGADAWYDTEMLTYTSARSWTFPFDVSALATGSSSDASLELVVWGVTNFVRSPDHHLQVSVNGVRVSDERFDGLVEKVLKVSIPSGTLHEGSNTLELTLPGDTGNPYDLVNLDKFSVIYPRAFRARNGRLTFTSDGKAFTVTDLPSSDVSIYRADGADKIRLRGDVAPGAANTYSVTFAGTGKLATYFVSTSASVLVPEMVAAREQVDLNTKADLLVISHPNFIAGLTPLIDQRRSQGLTVNVVDVNDVYAQYTYGVFDPSAIKKYIAYAVRNLGTKAVLLVGGDTYDYRNYLGVNSVSFIPSIYVSTGSIAKFVPADPSYADVNDDNVPDVAIGRFPVRSASDLDLMVRKTLAYDAKDYGRTSAFVSDLFDGTESFSTISNALAAKLPAGWTAEHIDLDRTDWATARAAVINAMNRGTSLVTYVGHSGTTFWGTNGLFRRTDGPALTNAGRPFIAVQWGCWNTYYVEPVNNTMVQSLLFSGDKGAAAMLGSSTLVNSESEELLGKSLTPRMVIPGASIGQALQDAKTEVAKTHPELSDVMLGWTLMGDPTLVVDPRR